jgi:hypothetical protein
MEMMQRIWTYEPLPLHAKVRGKHPVAFQRPLTEPKLPFSLQRNVMKEGGYCKHNCIVRSLRIGIYTPHSGHVTFYIAEIRLWLSLIIPSHVTAKLQHMYCQTQPQSKLKITANLFLKGHLKHRTGTSSAKRGNQYALTLKIQKLVYRIR